MKWVGSLGRIARERRVMLLAANEILLSLNLALGIVYGAIRYSAGVVSASSDPLGVLCYYFLRAAVRVNDILRLNPAQPAPWAPETGTSLGIDLAYILTVLGIAATVLVLLRVLCCAGASAQL